jgi:hypothetical protein
MPVSSIIGAAASVGGALLSNKGAKSAANTAANAQNAQLDFDMQRYDDWQNIFGGLQENLSNYYNSINPDYYVSAGLEAFEKERENQMTRLNETLAQRGLKNSGIAATVGREDAISSAETRANIRREAPRQAREDQSRFLQIGMGQNPASSVSSTLGNISQNATNASNAAQQAAGQAAGQAISTVGKAFGDYATKQGWGE